MRAARRGLLRMRRPTSPKPQHRTQVQYWKHDAPFVIYCTKSTSPFRFQGIRPKAQGPWVRIVTTTTLKAPRPPKRRARHRNGVACSPMRSVPLTVFQFVLMTRVNGARVRQVPLWESGVNRPRANSGGDPAVIVRRLGAFLRHNW